MLRSPAESMIGRIVLDENSTIPLYRQLSERLGEMIRSGVLPDGERIPPTRELAGQIGLHRTTVAAAYGLLEAEGLIRGYVGRGSFVSYQRSVPAPGDETDRTISFASSRPSADDFPLEDFKHSTREVLSAHDAATVLQLGSPAGYAPLRKYLLDEAEREGTRRDDDDLLVTNGCQQGLDLLQRTLAPPGSVVAVEDPVYHGVRHVFERAGVQLVGLPVGENGISIQDLARVCVVDHPAMVILTPDFHNPCGATMPLEARKDAVHMAASYGFTLVENSIYRDLRYKGEQIPSLKELDRKGGSVVSLRSFSKVAFPGLRVGWLLGHSTVVRKLTDERQWCDLHTDSLSQAILYRFAISGRLADHMRNVRERGRERLDTTLAALAKHMPRGSWWTDSEGGFNLWLRLPEGLDAEELLPAAEQAGVSYLPGSFFRIRNNDTRALRLSFGGLSPEAIERGIQILARVCNERLHGPKKKTRPTEPSPALV